MSRAVQIIVVLFFALPSCSVNILKTFADPLTNEALLYDAKMLINDGDYSGALAKFADMSADFLALADTRVVHASAYAGVCGLDFLQLINDLGSIGTTNPLLFLMQKFGGGTDTKRDACIAAEAEIQAISKYAASRTADQNLLMAMIGMAKVGVILSKNADASPADGNVDGAFDPCSTGSISNADARHVATGILVIKDALSNVGSSSVGSSVVADATTACAAVPTFCGAPPKVQVADLDTTSPAPNDDNFVRTLIYEGSAIGLNALACGGGDPSTCNCP